MTSGPRPPHTDTPILDCATVACKRGDNGHLRLLCPDREWEDVHFTPTFPLSRRFRLVAVRNPEGNEIAMLDDVAKLDPESKQIVADEMERSYFMPVITDILSVEEKLNVLTLEVETDRGPRTVQLRNPRKSIRKLPRSRVVIGDVDNNRYEIRDWTQLAGYGRELLGQYM